VNINALNIANLGPAHHIVPYLAILLWIQYDRLCAKISSRAFELTRWAKGSPTKIFGGKVATR
jgi:hypothetical protein